MEHRTLEWWQVMIGSSFRYWLFAGVAYLVFYIWRRNTLWRFKIQPRFPNASAIRTEVWYSMSTVLIFGFVIYGTLFSPLRAYTKLYDSIEAHSLLYFFFSIGLVLALHDTYFYWMHRLMHWKKLFRHVHQVHHRSHNPTPLAAFSFHPLEALIEVAVLPLIVLLIPVHKFVVGIFGVYMIVMNVMGHLGFELFPERFIRNPLLRLFNTSTHHNMHHHYGRGNYGLYFNLWDRVMGTNHTQYEEEFVRVSRRARSLKGTAGGNGPVVR